MLACKEGSFVKRLFNQITKMKNKTIIITGANSGIGLATAKVLAQTGAKIIMTARDFIKGQRALKEVKDSSNNPDVHLQIMDLASLDSIYNASREILHKHERIDILINNAGIMSLKKNETVDGFEEQFGVNHLGHFLLTNLVLSRIEQTAKQYGEARVIFLSSGAHQRTKGIDFDDLGWEKRKYEGFTAYADSKLANILTANEIARRYGEARIFTHSLAPGAVKTNIYKNDSIKGIKLLLAKLAFAIIGISPEKGAATLVFLATSPEATKVNGRYWKKSKITQAKLPENEEAIAGRLWKVSMELTGLAKLEG